MIITTSSTWSSLVIEMISTWSSWSLLVMIMITTSSSPKFWFECECFRLTRPQWDTAVGCLLARSTVQGGQIHIRIFRICEFEFEFVFVKAGSNWSAFQKGKFIFQSVFVENCVKSISITMWTSHRSPRRQNPNHTDDTGEKNVSAGERCYQISGENRRKV